MIDVAPIMKNDRTFFPVRAIAEALGFKVSWNNENRIVAIEHDNIDYKNFWIEKEYLEDMILSKPYDEDINYIDRLIEVHGKPKASSLHEDGYYYLDFDDFSIITSENQIKEINFNFNYEGKTMSGIGINSKEADIKKFLELLPL